MPDASNLPAKPYLVSLVRALGIFAFLLAICALPPMSHAAPPTSDQEHALAESRQRIEALDYRASGRLTRTDATGKRINDKFNIKGHWFADGMRLLVEITDPAAGTARILLHMTANGRVTIDVASPGSKAPAPLPFERWTEGMLGTDFSYEDLLETQFFWKSQEFLPPADYSSRKCFVLKSVPDAADRSHYTSVTSWVDRDIFYPVHVIKAMRSGQQKEFNYFGFQQNSGVWSATHLEVKMQGAKASSVFVVERGSGKAKLTLKDFDLSSAASKNDKSVSQ